MVALTLTTLLVSLAFPVVNGYVRMATAVGGDVVLGAGNLTQGGKVGLYTVLLQVLNPNFGDLQQLLQCCGKSAAFASEIATLVNTNAITGDIEKTIGERYVGNGKCEDPGISALMDKGNPTCSYLYTFKNKDFKDYSYTSMCVPSDVCSVDVAGASKGMKLGYEMVLKVLNRNMGELEYAGEGPLQNCYDGMNMVNLANQSFKHIEQKFIQITKGVKIPIGKEEKISFNGMKQLGFLKMMEKCEPRPDTGVLYVFKNKFWSESQKTLNITNFDMELAKKRIAEENAKNNIPIMKMGEEPVLKMGGEPILKMGDEVDLHVNQVKPPKETPQEKMADVMAIAEVTKEETAGLSGEKKVQAAKAAIDATNKNLAKEKAPEIAGLGGSDALLLQKASDSTVVEGVVDKTIANLRGNLAEAAQAAKAAKAADAEIQAKAAKAAAAAAKPPTPSEPVVDTSAPAAPPAPAAAKPATPPAPVVDISPPATPPAPESPNRMTKEEWQHERVDGFDGDQAQQNASPANRAAAREMEEEYEAEAIEKTAEILAEERAISRRLDVLIV